MTNECYFNSPVNLHDIIPRDTVEGTINNHKHTPPGLRPHLSSTSAVPQPTQGRELAFCLHNTVAAEFLKTFSLFH